MPGFLAGETVNLKASYNISGLYILMFAADAVGE